jgi:hypothetical protein
MRNLVPGIDKMVHHVNGGQVVGSKPAGKIMLILGVAKTVEIPLDLNECGIRKPHIEPSCLDRLRKRPRLRPIRKITLDIGEDLPQHIAKHGDKCCPIFIF